MISLICYEVYDCFTVDGIGPNAVIGRFTNKDDAEKYSFGHGNYGQKAFVRELELNICENLDEIEL